MPKRRKQKEPIKMASALEEETPELDDGVRIALEEIFA